LICPYKIKTLQMVYWLVLKKF